MILKKNVGHADSLIRVVVGAVIIIAGLYFDTMWGLVGLIPLFSGTASFCPVYRLLNIETCKPNIERAN
jgi:hypothetical protein